MDLDTLDGLGLDFSDDLDPEDCDPDPADEAVEVLRDFFSDRQYFCGGPIPGDAFVSPTYISALLCYDFESAVDRMHRVLESVDWLPSDVDADVSPQIQMVVNLVNMTKDARVEPCFVGGLILVALELLYGVRAV